MFLHVSPFYFIPFDTKHNIQMFKQYILISKGCLMDLKFIKCEKIKNFSYTNNRYVLALFSNVSIGITYLLYKLLAFYIMSFFFSRIILNKQSLYIWQQHYLIYNNFSIPFNSFSFLFHFILHSISFLDKFTDS